MAPARAVAASEGDKIEGLSAGSPVRIGGINVGRVLDFELDTKTYHAIVHMSIQSGISLPKDTSVLLTSAGLLGGKFLVLEPGSADEKLKPGGTIEKTRLMPSMKQLIGQLLSSLTRNKDENGSKAPACPAPAATSR